MTNRALCAALLVLAVAVPAWAQQAPAAPRPPAQPAAPDQRAAQVAPPGDDRGAQDTRNRLRQLLDQYPPSVRQVLRIDTSLLTRPDYLATYPALASFLEQHPEVAHNPTYFVGDAPGGDSQPADPRTEAIRAWRGFAEMIPVVAIVFIITSALAGLIRTLVEHRRWQRAARMQMDLQTKLVDRFSGSDELLAYVQSPAGRGLTGIQAPTPTPSAIPNMMDAPLGRIFWSLQAGIVLAATGVGLMFVGGRITFDELSQPLSGTGILALAVGVGFVVSAGVSYFIAQRLDLVTPPGRRDLGHEAPRT